MLRLDDPAGISELIASTFGLAQEAVDFSDLESDLHEADITRGVARVVSAALADVQPRNLRGNGLTRSRRFWMALSPPLRKPAC